MAEVKNETKNSVSVKLENIPPKWCVIVGIGCIEKDKEKYYVYHFAKPFPEGAADIGYQVESQFAFDKLRTDDGVEVEVGDIFRISYSKARKTKAGEIFQDVDEVRIHDSCLGKKLFGNKSATGKDGK